MESLPNPSAAPKVRAKSSSSDRLLDLRSSLSAVNAPLGNEDSKLRSSRKMGSESKLSPKIVAGEAGYVLEDVPHLTDYIPDLSTYPNPLQDNPAYSVVKQYFVNQDDTDAQKIPFNCLSFIFKQKQKLQQ